MHHGLGVTTTNRGQTRGRPMQRTTSGVAGVLALASLLTACGGGADRASDATSATSSASVTTPAPVTTTSAAQPGATTAGAQPGATSTAGQPGATSTAGQPGATSTAGQSGATSTASPSAGTSSTAVPAQLQLPRGGTKLFPAYRLFGYSGAPGSAAFGRLGTGDLDQRGREIEQRGKAWAGGRKLLPVFELITVIVDSVPGKDGDYNRQVSAATIDTYLAAARRHRGLLLLDVQPGRDDFLTVAKQLEPWLKQPDVGLALDPEWAVEPGQVPGRVYGRTTGAELDSVAAYLDRLVRTYRLPQKVMVFHQVAAKVVTGQDRIKARPGVVVIKSVDGIGSPGAKTATWSVLVRKLPPSIHTGFKLFYEEDARHGPLMTPKQVLALRPQPEYVLFE